MILVSGGTFGILSSCCRKHLTVRCWQLHFSGHPIAFAPFTKAVAATMSTIAAAKRYIFTQIFLFISFFFTFLLLFWIYLDSLLWILHYNFQQIIFHISNVILCFTFMDSLILIQKFFVSFYFSYFEMMSLRLTKFFFLLFSCVLSPESKKGYKQCWFECWKREKEKKEN